MNKIRLLPPSEALKIAAGEVVERPANIVKELVENSIDAGSTVITLHLERAGKQCIRIIDNGCGMTPDDARLCFAPHATSKISSLDDLGSIQTFGFRGEALASIAAVSNVTLITRTHAQSDQLGIHIDYTAGTLVKEQPVACPEGTDLMVANLFYNTPVRKKFLKQDVTELNQIMALVNASSLSNPQITFKIFHDNKLVLHAPAVANVKDRSGQLWDYGFAENLLPLEPIQPHPDYPFALTGYISQPGYCRYGRDLLFFFVNNRWVKNNELAKALLKGYLNVLPQGRFPAAFIFITIDVALVDVNVHPKKEEVRFARPGIVEQLLTAAAQRTLELFTTQKIIGGHDYSIHHAAHGFETPCSVHPEPVEGLTANGQFMERLVSHTEQVDSYRPLVVACPPKTCATAGSDLAHEPQSQESTPIEIGHLQKQRFLNHIFNQTSKSYHPGHPPSPRLWRAGRSGIQEVPAEFQDIPPVAEHQTSFEHATHNTLDGTIIGQLFSTYILIEHNDEFIMVDQHAAHERILYEEFLKNFEYKEGTALLFPEVVKIPKQQLTSLLREKDFFARQGMIIEQFGREEVVIKTAPPKLNHQSLKEIMLEAAAFIEEHETLEYEDFRKRLNEHVHSHMACKAAVKAGDVLSKQEMQGLVAALAKTEKRFICVHGRPTIWTLKRSVIEKNFKRT